MRRDDDGSMTQDPDAPLPIAHVRPAWLVDAVANGVVPYIADMAQT